MTELDWLVFEENHFVARAEALDWLDLDADQVQRLVAVDDALFARLRERVRCGECRGEAFRKMVSEFVQWGGDAEAYDHLDLFMNHLFGWREMPIPTQALEPEMVEYYKTPARVVFDLVERYELTADDVFVDLGSGLGEVVFLVNLLTGASARGIEIEPAYCEYAREEALRLGLRDVSFVAADVREADLSDGTVFFLYTPFKGTILRALLERLRKESLSRRIRVIPYGPCTAAVRAVSTGSCRWF
ncbi:MAG TPA: methyltransferase domain-containing protein [Puia sp.]|jgi:hypothetical protein